MFAQADASPLPAGSRNAALLVRLPPGIFTALVEGAPAGRALVEVYVVP